MSEETTTVRVPLTVEQRADKADAMARLVTLISGIEEDKAAYARKRNDEIKEHQAELEALALEVTDGAQEKSQLDLFVGEDEAKRGLAEVAKHACSCEGGADADVKSPSCPTHGVDSPAAKKAREESDARIADSALAQEVAETTGHPPSSNVVSMAEALRANEVNVGTVREPAAVTEHNAKRGRS